MEFEFDKEIDALLRRTAKSETASANNKASFAVSNPKSQIHLDADEISAFAENALPEKTKQKYTAHFADCERCRTILSNLIALNSETETIAASPAVSTQVIETKAIAWYRKLFAFPQLAYTLGALVVLFGGFIAFTVVKNINEATGSQSISQVSERERSAGGPSFDGETELSIPNAAANTMMSNAMSSNTASANTTSNMMMSNAASTSATNAANASTNSAARTANANSTATQSPRAAAPQPAPPAIVQSAPTQAETFSADAAGSSVARISEDDKKTADKQDDAEKTETERTEPRSDSLPLSARKTNPAALNDSAPKAKARTQNSSGAENRQIGGKTFARKEGVWYDASYNGQATTNVSRGSDDYKKLDSGLRSIAENLSGTVVIVWKNRAYRIQ